jgi:hypothetical protein
MGELGAHETKHAPMWQTKMYSPDATVKKKANGITGVAIPTRAQNLKDTTIFLPKFVRRGFVPEKVQLCSVLPCEA